MAFKFLKTGSASAKMSAQAEAEAEQRKQNAGKIKAFRFSLRETKKGQPADEARITFVDGDLAKDGPLAGYLDPPRYYEHNMFLNGQWFNFFVCPERTNPESGDKCPFCESGDRPAFVALFTVIDHRTFTGKGDKKYQNTKKLLVAKPQTFELLTKHAIKRGGLAGTSWDVSRVGDKSASVGSLFDFVEKKSIEDLMKQFQIEQIDPKTNQKTMVTNFTPLDYEKELDYKTGDQLRADMKKADADDDIPFKQPGAEPGAPDYSKEL